MSTVVHAAAFWNGITMPIAREFIDWDHPILPEVVNYLIDRYATPDQLDLSNVVLVFTGRRASRRMLELLVDRAADRWPAVIPPRMVTFQRFPELLYRQQRKLAEELTQLLVWKRALEAVPHDEIRIAIPSLPPSENISAWMALCESLLTQHNELAADGMDFDEVFVALSQAGNHTEAARWKALRRVQSEYLMQMDDLELWDRQVARLVAVEQQECRADFDIVLVGTVDISRIVRKILSQVSNRVTALIHAPESEAALFDEFGCLVPEAWVGRRLDIPVSDTRIVDTPQEQAVAAVSEIGHLDPIRRADEVVVGIGNDGDVPAILQSLSDVGGSGHWPVGSQVKASRAYRLLEAACLHLASARSGQPPDFATLCDLVRHPDMNSWVDSHLDEARSDRIHWLTRLDQYLAKHLQLTPGTLLGTKKTRDVVAAVCSSVDNLLLQLLPETEQQHVGQEIRSTRAAARGQRQLTFDDHIEVRSTSLASQLERKRPLSEWAEGCLRLLSAAYRSYQTGQHAHRDASIVACCSALTDVVDLLKQIPSTVMPRCSASQGLQLILRQISGVTIAPEFDEHAIDLLGWLELQMDDTPVLILTGFNDGNIPQAVTSDVFLPNSLRSQLGLNDNHRRYGRDAYALTAIMHSREEVKFITSRKDQQGNPLIPSRLWFAANPSELADRVCLFFDPERSEEFELEPASDEFESASKPSGFTVPCPPVTRHVPEEIPVTAFRDFLYCPYRYFLKQELRLRPVESEVRELTPAAFGNLIHHILNKFGESAVSQATTAEPIEEFLINSLNRRAQQLFGRNRSATVAVQLQMVANRLRAFAHWQATHSKDGWRIQYTEEDLLYPDFQDTQGRTVALAGRVDRIDRHVKTGQWRVLDYKTSEVPNSPERMHQRNGEWIDLQLPLYRLLIKSKQIEGDVDLGYIHLPGDLSKIGEKIANWNATELESAYSTARTVAADILDLQIDRVTPGNTRRAGEFVRICQDTVINRNIPWLEDWNGREVPAREHA